MPLTTCDLSKKTELNCCKHSEKERKFDFDYVLNSPCWLYNPFPIKLGGCVESSTFCPFLSWKFRVGWFHISLVALGDTEANYTNMSPNL